MKDKSNSKNIYISWILIASFFLYQYILRGSPGVLIEEIRADFLINADQFSLIGAMYYLGYSLTQIPLGAFVDNNGIKRTVIYSILLCILGTVFFVITKNIYIGIMSRFFVGIGSASAFMCSVKLANDCFPKSKQGVAMGAVLAFGAVGALITGIPLNLLLKFFTNWRDAFYVFAFVGAILLVMCFVIIPNDLKEKHQNNSSFLKGLKEVIQNKITIIYAIIAIGLFIPLSVMADLWGVAFLVRKFEMTREVASPILMNIYIGMAFGSIIIPLFLRWFHINFLIKICSIVLLFLFSLLVYSSNISYNFLIWLLILIGFFCGAEMLCFAAALKNVDSKVSGITIGVVNTLNMLSGAIMQRMIGVYLDMKWEGNLTLEGLRLYTALEFVDAFTILVILMAGCCFTAFYCLKNKD